MYYCFSNLLGVFDPRRFELGFLVGTAGFCGLESVGEFGVKTPALSSCFSWLELNDFKLNSMKLNCWRSLW